MRFDQSCLAAVVGDANHIPHDPPLESDKIEINVK